MSGQPAAAIAAALKSGDIAAARAALEAVRDDLGRVALARLEARVCLAEDRPDAALAALDAVARPGATPAPAEARLRFAAHLAQGDAVAAAEDCAALEEGEQIRGGQVTALVEGLFAADRPDLLRALLPRIDVHSRRFQRGLRRLPGSGEAPALRRAAGFIAALAPALDSPMPAMEAANALFLAGEDQLAERQVADMRGIIARLHAAGRDPFAFGEPRWSLPEGAADAVLDWQGIAAADRPAARAELVEASHARDRMTMELVHDPAHAMRFVAQSRAELSLLTQMGRGGGGIVAATHLGQLMGLLCQFCAHDLPISVLGGPPAVSHLVPGGDRLVPIRRGKGASAALRRILRDLKAGQLVAIAGDAGQSDRVSVVQHDAGHGPLTFTLPNTVPELAYRLGKPVAFASCHLEQGSYITRALPAPAPAPGETQADYTARFHRFFLDRLWEICRADLRNGVLHPSMFAAPDHGPPTEG